MRPPLLVAKNDKAELSLPPGLAKSAAPSIGSELGRQVLRGVLRSIPGGKRR